MLDPERFVERVERDTGQTVRASGEARRITEESVIGKAGLLCAIDDGLAFIEDAILEPGEVTTTLRTEIGGATIEPGTLGSTLTLETTGGPVVFENLDDELAERIVEAAAIAVKIATRGAKNALEPASVGRDATDLPDPTMADARSPTCEPVSAQSEERWNEPPDIELGNAREAAAVEAAADSERTKALALLTAAQHVDERAAAGRKRSSRKRATPSERARRRPRRRKQQREPARGPYRWVAFAVPAVLAAAGWLYHWSVAVLLGCIGYVVGLYVAERLHHQRRLP